VKGLRSKPIGSSTPKPSELARQTILTVTALQATRQLVLAPKITVLPKMSLELIYTPSRVTAITNSSQATEAVKYQFQYLLQPSHHITQ